MKNINKFFAAIMCVLCCACTNNTRQNTDVLGLVQKEDNKAIDILYSEEYGDYLLTLYRTIDDKEKLMYFENRIYVGGSAGQDGTLGVRLDSEFYIIYGKNNMNISYYTYEIGDYTIVKKNVQEYILDMYFSKKEITHFGNGKAYSSGDEIIFEF